MKVAFDLDGTLDKKALRALALTLINGKHDVHVITAFFPEGGKWQDAAAKLDKLRRLGIPFVVVRDGQLRPPTAPWPNAAILHIFKAMPATYDRAYRLADLGLRKGDLCEKLGIEIYIDDSPTFCEVFPRMNGNTTILQVH